MVAPRFSPGVRRAVTADVSAALLFTFFAGLTGPFTGLILRRELGATPLQLSVMSAAAGACLLLSLAWARALHGRAPLPYLVWPSFLARAVFLLVPFAASAWSFVSLVVAANFFGAAAGPAQAAVASTRAPSAGARWAPCGWRVRSWGSAWRSAPASSSSAWTTAGSSPPRRRWAWPGASLSGSSRSPSGLLTP